MRKSANFTKQKVGSESLTARKGIKTCFARPNWEKGIWSESLTARKGIKTFKQAKRNIPQDAGSESLTARKGIKTNLLWRVLERLVLGLNH